MFEVRFFTTAAGRCPPKDFLESIPDRDYGLIAADIEALRIHGIRARISVRAIKGQHARGLMEIKCGNYRVFYCVQRGPLIWILHACKKEHQSNGIEAARNRMQQLRG